MARRSAPPWATVRDALLFLTGLSGIVYEVLAVTHPDPTVLLLLGTMCGLPAFLGRDEKSKDEVTKD